MDSMRHDGVCSKCWGVKYMVIGIVVLITAINWPNYIWHVIAVLLILKGIMKLVMPGCSHCQPTEVMKKAKK